MKGFSDGLKVASQITLSQTAPTGKYTGMCFRDRMSGGGFCHVVLITDFESQAALNGHKLLWFENLDTFDPTKGIEGTKG